MERKATPKSVFQCVTLNSEVGREPSSVNTLKGKTKEMGGYIE